MRLKSYQIFMVMLSLCLGLLWLRPNPAQALTDATLYRRAEICYQNLLKDKQKSRYRDAWLRCISQFQDVFRADPDGPEAAAGLYMSGKLYQELYQRSGRLADKKEAVDIFERALKRYPQSPYRAKAEVALRALAGAPRSKTKPTSPEAATAPPSKTAPLAAKKKPAAAAGVKPQSSSAKTRATHTKVDTTTGKLALNGPKHKTNPYPKSTQAPDEPEEKPPSIESVIAAHKTPPAAAAATPEKNGSKPADKANGKIERPAPTQPASTPAKTAATQAPAASPAQAAQTSSLATVTGIRYWSNPHYTRVVVDANAETEFEHTLLKKDPSISKPQRLFIDLKNSLLGPDIKTIVPINDDLLLDARAGQYRADTVRVVIDIKSYETYKIFPLKNPFRIVVDMRGAEPEKIPVKKAMNKRTGKEPPLPPGALARQLSLGVRRVVIDPGHGGHDFGAPGYLKGIYEKNVVLQISKRLAAKVRKELGFEVIMTRTTDRYLTLEERTAIANTKNADLFISIHTNSHKDRRATGIETYILNLATDDDAIRVAAFENATSEKNISDLQTILSDLMQNAKINESARLAGYVQTQLSRDLSKKYSRIRNKGVKQAPFYVLLGAEMPSILVETSFISNPRECERLIDPTYQEYLCDGIIDGIRRYLKEIKPMAMGNHSASSRHPG